jgi:hypothetical protein
MVALLIAPTLAPTIPTSSASATRQIRSMSWEKKYPASPTSVLFASFYKVSISYHPNLGKNPNVGKTYDNLLLG